MAGYHQNFIMKFPHGNVHKLKEEVDEFLDAYASGNPIMAMQELSDIYLILRTIANDYGIDVSDLAKMADTTESVFLSGDRTSSSLFEMIRSNTKYISLSVPAPKYYFICEDINYEYILVDSETETIILPAGTEYFEVLAGEVYVEDQRIIEQYQCSKTSITFLEFKSKGLIMTKSNGLKDNLNSISHVSYNKSDKIFDVLKASLEEFDV